jgi:hypothetical protein
MESLKNRLEMFDIDQTGAGGSHLNDTEKKKLLTDDIQSLNIKANEV